eukprot:CAMPEP_0183358712 /NCGR_PEP_ID=MMETSP0164_2-20130417/50038_1 /TAXON_ID=221442 /ORGANISM="Coccolithus pelagicus ssp braarudi, Strain PLY182g" /LENGTH=265 /DNA_ID=CAMNT_0025532653 /DNA_START=29 /DNA_END=827 /DNA_ORIENTATION=+
MLSGFLALLCLASPASARRLPVSSREMSAQAAAALVRALEFGHRRLQLTVPQTPLVACAQRLVHELEASGMRTRVFLSGIEAVDTWINSARVGQPRCDVLGLGEAAVDDGAFLIVSPCNRPHPMSSVAFPDEPDAHTLDAVQMVLARARDRPVIMINADLEALVLHSHAVRPVRPMFMADFEHAYYLATKLPSERSFGVGECVAVLRAFPSDWEVFTSATHHPNRAQPMKIVLKHRLKNKPPIADEMHTQSSNRNLHAGPQAQQV